ncbi:uncharacterized protein LOC124159150 isoform X5 [Ischnura elegans]|uniref:uncharacterized protein LOC124159150 isoform X5 n=1 Tax=Ischnura elegans TaxID=197161 RepID=UPI001ED89DE8|nr:uncharacterized protein LOC124159150 isoform X5 [Ischnura elegans]
MRTRSAVARLVSSDPVPEIASTSTVFPVAEKGGVKVVSAARGVKPSETARTDCPTRRGPEKKGNEVRVGGALVKLKELSVLIRRLTPEEIMLHTRKSSRKRKADSLKTTRNKNQPNKKFRRIWVVSDNSDEDSDSNSGTAHEVSNNTNTSSEKQCDSKSTQDQGHCPQVKQGMKKDIKDCKLCNKRGGTISEKSCFKHRAKKLTGNQSEKGRLTESDRQSVVSQNNCELQFRTKVNNYWRESIASKNSNGKVNGVGKNVVTRSPSNVDISQEIVPNKLGVLSKGPTFADSVNLPDRLLLTNGEHRKIPKTNTSHDSSLLHKGIKSKNSPPKTDKEPNVGKKVVNDLKSVSVPTTTKSPVPGSLRENNPPSLSPMRAVENAPLFPERVNSKEISRVSHDNIYKESHATAPEKPPSVDVHDIKGINKKTCKNKDSHIVSSDKLNYNASPVRQVKKSSLPGEILPKEVPNASSSLSKQNPAPTSKENPFGESVSNHDRDHKVKANVLEKSIKSKDGHCVVSDKYSKRASPVRQQENVPVPCERLGPKKTGHSDIISKETHSAKEKLHSDSVSDPKEKSMGKKSKSKDGQFVEGNMIKNCASPVRSSVLSSPSRNEKNGPKEMVKSKNSNSPNDILNTSMQEKSLTAQDDHMKERSGEKIVSVKDADSTVEVSSKVVQLDRSSKYAEVCHSIQGSLGVQISDHASNDKLVVNKETGSAPSGKELPCDSDSNSGNEALMNSNCQAVNGSSIGELSKKLGPVADSTESADASGVLSDEASTRKDVSPEESILSKAESKQSHTNAEKVRHIPRSCAVKGIENTTPNVQEARSAATKESVLMDSKCVSVKDLNPISNEESKPKKKHPTQNLKPKDAPVVHQISNPTQVSDRIEVVGSASGMQSVQSDETSTGGDASPKDNIVPNAGFKQSHTNAEKVRHLPRTSAMLSVSSQGKQTSEVTTTGPHQGVKDTCRREKDKCKIASTHSEKSHLASKIEKGQRRLSKSRRLSAEMHIPGSTVDPKVLKHSVPSIKSNEMEISKKSQPLSTLNQEMGKSPIRENEIIVLKSSLIEKSGCSSNQKTVSSSAIEADNVDQLMAQYETLVKHDSTLLVDRKSDRKLNQKKLRNIFGEDHLIEDSECILKSSIMGEGQPMSSPAFNITDLSSSSSFLEPSLQKSDFTASAISESSNNANKRRKNIDESKSVSKKRKLSIVRSRNAEGKSRRHSLQTSSSLPGKKTVGKGRSNLGRAVSCIETSHRDASFERSPEESNSSTSTSNSNVDLGTCRRVSLICSDVGKMSQEEGEEAFVDGGNATLCPPQGVSGMEEEAAAAENSSGEDSDVICLDIQLKEEGSRLEDIEEKVDPFNPESCPSRVLDQIVMSSPRTAPVEDGSEADLENYVDLSSIVTQVEADSGSGVELITEDDDLFDNGIILCDPLIIEQKLEELEEEVKRKEEEMQQAKAKKAKMFRVWEKALSISCISALGISSCTTEHEETNKVKKEHDGQDDLPETPLSETSQDCDVSDVKDEFDRNSTVSTEICESPRDPEELLQLSDSGENGSVDGSNLGNNVDPSVEGLAPSVSTVVVEPAVNNLRHTLDGRVEHSVNTVAVDKSAVVTVNPEGETQLSAQGFLRGITCIHDSGDQEAQASAIGTSLSSELTDSRIGENNENRNDSVGGMTPRREERIRVRGLSDLLAIPPSQPSMSQNNLATPQEPPSQDDPTVGTARETINPADRVVRDSFKGEKYYNDFKDLQAILAELGSALMAVIQSRNTPHVNVMRNNFGVKLRAHTGEICRNIPDVVHNFQYSEEGAFASFLYFQVSFLMPHHRDSFTLDHMKLLMKYVFHQFVRCWEVKTRQAIAVFYSKLYERMGMGTINLMPDNSNATPVGQNGNRVVGPNNSQSVTSDNNMLSNPQSSSTAPSCEPATVPLATSHQNLPACTMPIRNQQPPAHLVNNDCGNFQSRVNFSSASDQRINPNPPDVNHLRTAMQADSTHGVGNVPNVSVNPNHQLRGDPVFVPVVHRIPGTPSGVSGVVSGEISNVSQSRVVCRQVSHMNMAAGQLNTSHRNSLARQNSNVQNCINLPQPFQLSHINPTVNGQFSNSAHVQTGASALENLLRNPLPTQQNTAATICVNNNAGATQVSMPSSNRVQHRRPSLPVEMVRNQDSVQNQPRQGDPPPRYFAPRPGEVLSANPIHVPGNVGQRTPLHTSQCGYQPHQSRVNAEYHPINPSNQGTHNHFAQRQMPRSDMLVVINSQSNNHPSMPYFPSPSHNGSANSSRSLVVHPQDTVSSMPPASNAPLSTVSQNSGTEGVSGQSTSMGWNALQQQVSHPSMYSNNLVAEISGSTVVNHSVMMSNSVDGAVRNVSQVTSHSVFQQGTRVQHPQPGHPADIQPLMGQAVTRQSADVPTKHTSTVLHAAPHQMNPGASPYHSPSSYAPQQHNAGMMGVSHQGSRPNQSSFLEHAAASTAKRQTQLPSLTSPVLRSSPSGVTEDNDQARTVIVRVGNVEDEQSEKSQCHGASNQNTLACKSADEKIKPCKLSKKRITIKKKNTVKVHAKFAPAGLHCSGLNVVEDKALSAGLSPMTVVTAVQHSAVTSTSVLIPSLECASSVIRKHFLPAAGVG